MSNNQHPSSSTREVFILRLWHSLQNRSWVGEIQHVRSGRIMRVRNPAELLAYIETQMESPDIPATDRTQAGQPDVQEETGPCSFPKIKESR